MTRTRPKRIRPSGLKRDYWGLCYNTRQMRDLVKNPFRIGWESVKANAVPMVVLWGLAVALTIGYYSVPAVRTVLEPLKAYQVESGWLAAFLNRVIFCGVLPGVFLITVKTIRPKYPLLTVLANCAWTGLWGVLCDWFFTLQSILFGQGTDFVTVITKTTVEQLIWTALICVPLNMVFFFWVSHDFSLERARQEWPHHFVRDACLPLLIADWFVWIPVSVAVYLFPLPLQIQLTGFAGAFWILVALQVGARSSTGRKV